MAQVPNEVKEGIQKLAEKKEVPVKDLLGRLKQIISEQDMKDPKFKSLTDPSFKIRIAWAALYKEYATAQGQKCLFKPLLHSAPRYIRTKDGNTAVADISALVKPLEDEKGNEIKGEWTYGAGTFWREAAKNLEDLEVGKVYQTSMILSSQYGPKGKKKERDWGYGLIANNATFQEVNEKAPSIEKFYEDEIEDNTEKLSLSDVDVNESAHDTDIRVIEIMVTDSDIGEKDGNEFGLYTVMDTSITGATLTLFVDPRDTMYIQGSILKMGVIITDISKKDEDQRFKVTPQWIIPRTAEEKDIIRHTGDDDDDDEDTITLGDDDEKTNESEEERREDEVKEESKEESKEEKKEEKGEEQDLFEI